jgi:formylglycine-generating enzyme
MKDESDKHVFAIASGALVIVAVLAVGCDDGFVPASADSTAVPDLGARKRSDAAALRFTNSLGMQFVMIRAGMFRMGAADGERFGRYSEPEQPQHVVTLTKPFWMCQYETTVGQFRQFVAQTGYRTEGELSGKGCNRLDRRTGEIEQSPGCVWTSPGFAQTEQHPVVCVSWEDADQFCRWLSRKEKCTYRLPTEAEWEYACRAGTDTLFSTGDAFESLTHSANCGDDSLRKVMPVLTACAAWNDGYAFTAPVGRFMPNAFGLYDMHGNVGEWCRDWYDSKYYSHSPGADPCGPALPTQWHVVRGGSWYNTPAACRCAGRHDGVPTAASITNGFRLVMEP